VRGIIQTTKTLIQAEVYSCVALH